MSVTAVARLDAEQLRRYPPHGEELFDVGHLEHADHPAVVRAAQQCCGGPLEGRELVHEEATVRREADIVIGVLRREQLQAGAVEVHAIEVLVIRVAPFLATPGREVDAPGLRVDVLDLVHDPRAAA
jgi:hypothetical protein